MKALVFSEKKIKCHSCLLFRVYTLKRSEKDKTYVIVGINVRNLFLIVTLVN